MKKKTLPTFVLLLALCCLPCAYGQAEKEVSRTRERVRNDSAKQPNIVFLLADDMGYGDLGCFGSRVIQSPNLDRLATQGMKLNQCYAASPNCSPARTAMLTGRHPYRVGMYDFARFKQLHIPSNEITIAESLKSAGYATMFAGKWHCSGDFESGDQPYPGDQGFDHWLAHAKNFGKDPVGFKRNGKSLEKLEGWMSEIVVNETIEWLESRKNDKPFFTCLWFSEPHTPVVAADEFRKLYPESKIAEHVERLKGSGENKLFVEKSSKIPISTSDAFQCWTIISVGC